MKRVVYTLLMISLLCTVGCDEKNSTVAYNPDLSNLERYYVKVGDVPKMQFTKLNFSKAGTEVVDSIVFYRYRIQSEGRNETHGFMISFDLICRDSTMIEDAWYYEKALPKKGVCINNIIFRFFENNNEQNALVDLDNIEAGVFDNVKNGEYKFQLSGSTVGNINGERQYDIPVIWNGILTRDMLTGKDFTVEYQQ